MDPKQPFEKPAALYLDTNILIGGNWPTPGRSLTDLLSLANVLSVQLRLPQTAEHELWTILEEKWSQDLLELAKLLLKVNSRTSSEHQLETKVPQVEELLVEARARHKKLSILHNIHIAQVPDTSLANVLERSARHQSPFRKEDSGFRDSMILLTIQSDMQASSFATSVLLTDDRGMGKADTFLSKNRITQLRGVEDAQKILREHLAADLLKRLKKRNREIEHALIESKADLESYLRSVLKVPEELKGFHGRMINPRTIRVDGVVSVNFGLKPEVIDTTPVNASAELSVTISGEVARWPIPTPKVSLIGTRPADWSHFQDDVRYGDADVPVTVTLEFEVSRGPAGNLRTIPGNAWVGNSEDRLLEALAARDFSRKGAFDPSTPE